MWRELWETYWPWAKRDPLRKPLDIKKLGLLKDQYDILEVHLKKTEMMWDEYEAKAAESARRYEEILKVLRVYADRRNWAGDTSGSARIWILGEHGYKLARRWIKDELETEK